MPDYTILVLLWELVKRTNIKFEQDIRRIYYFFHISDYFVTKKRNERTPEHSSKTLMAGGIAQHDSADLVL